MMPFSYISKLSRRAKEIIVLSIDILIAIFATWISFFIRLDLEFFLFPSGNTLIPFALSILIFIPIFFLFKIYNSMFRYFDIKNMQIIFYASLSYLLIFFITIFYLKIPQVPRSIGIIQPIIFFMCIFMSRIIFTNIFNSIDKNEKKSKILIYGAGKAGVQASSLFSDSNKYKVIGFIDDDISKVGRKIFQYQIFNKNKIQLLNEKFKIDQVIIAILNIKDEEKNKILVNLGQHDISIKILPNVNQLVNSNISLSDFKEISVLDLIEKRNNKGADILDIEFINKKILITGAGGSIGSELCKQIIKFEPQKIIMIDNSEYNLYQIEKEISTYTKNNNSNTQIIAKLISVSNKKSIMNIFKKTKPDYVFHAAAYKHVPIVENNISESVENNYLGTVNMVNAAIENNCDRFVLISSDKAVRPTNIMGATKRLSEIYLQASNDILDKNKQIKLSIVRFGNVLDSSGSVVPIFRHQISTGGPITVTHPEVTRYFMTIPEAAKLILESSILAQGGEVFLLDMGKPMKILDLAIKMLQLSGYKRNGKKYINEKKQIEIIFTGLRPGEKLFEELMIDNINSKRVNDNILVANEKFIKMKDLEIINEKIFEYIENDNSGKIINLIKENIEEFKHKKNE
jgi:FlaA1/EpsC-like NDP-sugar epimerase